MVGSSGSGRKWTIAGTERTWSSGGEQLHSFLDGCDVWWVVQLRDGRVVLCLVTGEVVIVDANCNEVRRVAAPVCLPLNCVMVDWRLAAMPVISRYNTDTFDALHAVHTSAWVTDVTEHHNGTITACDYEGLMTLWSVDGRLLLSFDNDEDDSFRCIAVLHDGRVVCGGVIGVVYIHNSGGTTLSSVKAHSMIYDTVHDIVQLHDDIQRCLHRQDLGR